MKKSRAMKRHPPAPKTARLEDMRGIKIALRVGSYPGLKLWLSWPLLLC